MQWYPISLFSLSLVVTTAIHWSFNQSPSFFTPSALYGQKVAIAASKTTGNRIILNGREFPIAWTTWNNGNQTYLGISDLGAKELLGLDLIDGNSSNSQLIQWYSSEEQKNIPLEVRLQGSHRYLNVSNLLEVIGIKWSIQGNKLNLSVPTAQITNLRQGNQTWGQRIVIDLDRPTVWQVSQNKTEGVVMIEGVTSPSLLSQFPYQPTQPKTNLDEDDLGSGNPEITASSLVSVENSGSLSKIRINLPTSQGLRVFSVNNPPRIVIDVRPDYAPLRNITWQKDIRWKQQQITLGSDTFPVTWLEIDPKSPQISIKPITSASNSLEGLTPLVTMARVSNATAAINGGFFNRNNKLPLGAIRRDNQWLSSPILNRGVIAWDEQGNVKMARLGWQETVKVGNGRQFPILFLNSAYLQAGLSRYSPAWGTSYIPLTDGEAVITVQNNQVTRQDRGNKAGTLRFTIPKDGYLIVIRKNAVALSAFPVGTTLTLNERTNPPEMGKFPHIIGAGPLLLQNGRIVLNAQAETFSKAFQAQKASRSAIAVDKRGNLMIVAVHHRIGGKGASLDEFAQLLQRIG
ncbi:MAG: phosphodiester glycosidase family protein, partial [Microcystaceae cyanobacterium]